MYIMYIFILLIFIKFWEDYFHLWLSWYEMSVKKKAWNMPKSVSKDLTNPKAKNLVLIYLLFIINEKNSYPR